MSNDREAKVKWTIVNRAHPVARQIADRHYNRQNVGATGFVPPGRCLVLMTTDERALWVTSWPFAQYVKHKWGGAWICSCFRNEGAGLSSELIDEAVRITRWYWEDHKQLIPWPPYEGFVTFVDINRTRHKRDPGRCYRKAGWKVIGKTKGGLIALGLDIESMPAPSAPHIAQLGLFE